MKRYKNLRVIHLFAAIVLGAAFAPAANAQTSREGGKSSEGPTETNTLDVVMNATPAYDLTVRLLPEIHQMVVSGTLLLPPSNQSQTRIEFDLSELMNDLRVEIMEPTDNAGPIEVTKGDKTPEAGFNHWVIQLKQPIAAHKPTRIRLSYSGGEGGAMQLYVGPEGSFGGPNSRWYPQFGANAGRGKGRLIFSVPAEYAVLSNGDRRTQAADEANGKFEFNNVVPTRFAFSAGKYTVLQKRDAIVPMRLYLLRPRSNAGEYLDGCSVALAALAEEFGPYPFAEFAIAEVPSQQAQKAGFTGASMNGFMLANKEALDAPFNLAYYGHEIGHQWWGNLVGREGNNGDYMTDEAMAQFGSLRVVEKIEGSVAAEQYRRIGYPGYSAEQSGYGYLREFPESGLDHTLGDLPRGSNSHLLADSKGFLVLDLLSRMLGHERFSQALHEITRKYAFQSIRWEEFLATIQRASQEDLGWFFSQWLHRTGAPDLHVTWKQKDSMIHGEVTQTLPYYRLKLEVALVGMNGEQATHILDLTDGRTEFSFPASFRVRSVVPDPHFHVLHWLPDLHAAALAAGPAKHAFYLLRAGKLDEAEAELREALTSLPQPDAHGAQYWDEFALAMVFTARKAWTEARQHFDAALAAPSRDADNLPWLCYRYAEMAQATHDDAKARWAVDATISADAAASSQTMAPYMARSLLTPK